MAFVQQVKDFLLTPSKAFGAVKGVNLGRAFRYFLPLLLIYSVLLAILTAAAVGLMGSIFGTFFAGPIGGLAGGLVLGPLAALIVLVTVLIGGIIGVFIGGIWLHIWVYIFGGRKGIEQTIKVCMYAFTPTALIGWIPFINIIGGIWTLILSIIGVRDLHSITTGRAVAAVIIAAIIPLAIAASTGLIVQSATFR